MHTLSGRPTTIHPVNIDIGAWLRAGASVALIAASLGIVGTRLEDAPLPLVRPSAAVARDSAPIVGGEYVAMRNRVERTMPAVRMTTDVAEMLGRAAAITVAVQAASHASQGQVFTAVVARDVHAAIAADMARRSPSERASLMREVTTLAPRLNEPYPTTEALATFPSLLLRSLPRLPADLEYRFMRRDLIVRDARTNLIVDYLPNAMRAAVVAP